MYGSSHSPNLPNQYVYLRHLQIVPAHSHIGVGLAFDESLQAMAEHLFAFNKHR